LLTLTLGEFKKDKKEGLGVLTLKDSNITVLCSSITLSSVTVTLMLKDGSIYAGEFKDNAREGMGIQTLSSKARFDIKEGERPFES